MADYSKPTLHEAEKIANRFGIQVDSVLALPGGICNSTIIVSGPQGDFAMTFLDAHSRASAGRLSKLLPYLHDQGIPVPEVIRTPNGSTIGTYKGIPVMMKRFVDGIPMDPFPPSQSVHVGALLARLHGIELPQYVPESLRRIPSDWEMILIGHNCDDLRALIYDALDSQHTWQDLPKGLIHGDIFPDNLLLSTSGEITIIDWDTASIEPRVLEIGMSFIGLCRHDNSLDVNQMQELIKGYEVVSPLSVEEKQGLREATMYANAVLSYNRFVQYNIKYPEKGRGDLYKELVEFSDQVPQSFDAVFAKSSPAVASPPIPAL